jgi:subtilase family serine protease
VDGYNGAAGDFNLLVNVASPLPDLTGSWTQLTPYSGGRTLYGTLQVNNIGNANAGSFSVGYYLSNDGKTAGQLLGSQTVSSLKAGASMYLYPRLSFSSSISGKYIIARIDYTNKVLESNEANNVVTGKVSLTKAR